MERVNLRYSYPDLNIFEEDKVSDKASQLAYK